MATHDYIISNASGAAVRADLNNALAAIATNNSSATEPTTTYAYQWWADTGSSPTVMKLRNAANSAWITLFQLDGEWTVVPFENGTAAAPSIYFKDSGTDTGIYSPGTDQVAITTGGTARLYVGSTGSVGIGSTAPNRKLEISDATVDNFIRVNTTGATKSGIEFASGGTVYSQLYFNNVSPYDLSLLQQYTTGSLILGTNSTERARLDSAGRWLLGTSTARANLYNSSGTSPLQIEGTTESASAGLITLNSSTAAASPNLVFAKSAGTSLNSNTVVSADHSVGAIYFSGNDGSEFVTAARIEAFVDGTPGANDMPGRIILATTADGASTPTERARINNAGEFSFRNTSYVFPATDNAVSLGLTGFRFSAVWAANGTIQTSDERAKADITDAALGSEFIKALRPVSYKWIEGGKRDTGKRDEDENYIYESVPGTRTHWGFIAQEVKEAVDAAGVDFGGWVLTDKDDPDSQQALRYDQFIAPLTKALQETMAELEALKAEVAALKAQ